MTAVTHTAGSPRFIGTIGEYSLYVYDITDVDDAETLDTTLGERVFRYFVNWLGNPGTQAAAGGHSTESAGTITFYPGTDSLDATVYVLATGV